jgi:hypothetical protein
MRSPTAGRDQRREVAFFHRRPSRHFLQRWPHVSLKTMRDLMELQLELDRCRALLAGQLPDTARTYLVGAAQAIQWALGKNGSTEGVPSPSAQHTLTTRGRAP